MSHPPHIHTRTLGFGVYTSLPTLPAGWRWKQAPSEWLYAIEEETGRWFYVHFLPDGAVRFELKRVAGWWDWVRTSGYLKRGQHYCDSRFSVLLSNRGSLQKL